MPRTAPASVGDVIPAYTLRDPCFGEPGMDAGIAPGGAVLDAAPPAAGAEGDGDADRRGEGVVPPARLLHAGSVVPTRMAMITTHARTLGIRRRMPRCIPRRS